MAKSCKVVEKMTNLWEKKWKKVTQTTEKMSQTSEKESQTSEEN